MSTGFSATKGVAAVCMLLLHDRGLIDVDAPVSHYWPEYAQAGKEATLVRHVLNHTAGLLYFDDPGALLDWSGGGWDDYDEIARRIAASPPAWEPGTRIGYHAISVGWLCQELVRRVTGMTLGSFFAKEVAQPLGLSIFIGTPEAEQARLATAIAEEPDVSTPELAALHAHVEKLLGDPSLLVNRSAIYMHGQSLSSNMGLVNLPRVRSVEIPAMNGSMEARSLAKLYAVLAQGGELDGVRLVSSETVRLFGTMTFSGPSAVVAESGLEALMGPGDTRYALGFEGDFGEGPKPWPFGPSPQAFGHRGAGGQLGFADPSRKVAIGFVRNHMAGDWTVSTALVDALYGNL
jgi:CubicO group peptidase (beta-lactamase class C family)